MTTRDLDDELGGDAGACREDTLPRSDEDSFPTGWIRGHTKIGLVLEAKVAYHSYPCGIEVRVSSLNNDGSHSWIVISRRMNKYVDELYTENEESVYYKEMATGMTKPVATKHKGQSSPPKRSLSYGVSKTMSKILRHHGSHREGDGAIDWNILLPGMAGSYFKWKWQEASSVLPEL